MSSTIYTKPYSLAEFNFSLQLDHEDEAVKELVFKPNGDNLEIWIKNALFRKTDSAGGEFTAQIDIEELQIAPTGGTEYENYLSANKDRTQSDEIGKAMVLEGATIDRTGAVNIFRSGGVADDEVVSYTGDLDFHYKTNPDKFYLIRSEVLDGPDEFAESIIYGEIRIIKEGDTE